MDHRWGIVLNEDQIDQPVPFGEMGEFGMPCLIDQAAGCTFAMSEPSQYNIPSMLNNIGHSSSGFIQQHADIGWSESVIQAAPVESANYGSSQIHGFNNLGSYSAFQGGQAYTNLTPWSNSRVAGVNCSVPQRQQRHHPQQNMMMRSTPCTRKAPHRNPTQREIHILSERQRREEMNEKLSMLRSILPRLTKKDKASTITHAIKHLTELEEKVKSLRACKAVKKKQCKAEKAHAHPTEKRTEARADNNRSIGTFSKQFGGDSEDDKSCKIEIQNLGTHAILKILSPWSSRLLLRAHKALDECRVDVLQSIMTKHGGNAVYYFTFEFNSDTPSIDKLMSIFEEASSF